MRCSTTLTAMLSLLIPATALGWPPNRDFIPHGAVFGCATCHENPEGGGPRNVFGEDFEASGLQGWGPDLAALDSDDDGFTNGEELLDPDGTWRWFGGAPSPGDPTEATNPADPASLPQVGDDAPAEPEEQPAEPEEDPVEPQDDPVEPEEDPVEPEEDPVEPQDEPVEPQEEEPLEPQDGPAEPEDVPDDGELDAACASVDIGSPCDQDVDCGPEGLCLDHLLGGYCTADAGRTCCPEGAEAVHLEGGDHLCLKSCESDADCERGDDRSQHCDVDNTCWGCEVAQADVGASCATDEDCGERGVCVTDAFGWTFGGGYCAADAASWCCPEGGVEVLLGEGAEAPRWCVRACADDADCRAGEGYSCLQDVGACWPSPSDDEGSKPSDAESDAGPSVSEPPPTRPEGTPLPVGEQPPAGDEPPGVGREASTEKGAKEDGGCSTAPLGGVLLRLSGRR